MQALRVVACWLVFCAGATAVHGQKKADLAPLYLNAGEVGTIPAEGFGGIDKATVTAYQKIGAAWVRQRRDGVPWFCFSGLLGKRKLDLSQPFPDAPVEFGLHFTEFAPMTDAGMKQLAGLKHLTFLHLTGARVTAVGLKELAGLKKLKRLELANARIDDATLRVLHQGGLLHAVVGANFNPVDTERGDGKDHWDSAEDVTRFALMSTAVTDAGVGELAAFKNLEDLNLLNTRVTGTGLKALAKLEKLSVLQMSRATDDGMKGVASLKSLTDLTIYSFRDPELRDTRAKITDAGLKELASLPRLTKLSLYHCARLTDAGVAALRKALPRCKITVER